MSWWWFLFHLMAKSVVFLKCTYKCVARYMSSKGSFPYDIFKNGIFRPLLFASLKQQKLPHDDEFIIRKEMRFSHFKLLSISWLLQLLLIPHPPHFLFRTDFCIFTHENSISLIRLVHIYSHKQCAVIKNTIFFFLKLKK